MSNRTTSSTWIAATSLRVFRHAYHNETEGHESQVKLQQVGSKFSSTISLYDHSNNVSPRLTSPSRQDGSKDKNNQDNGSQSRLSNTNNAVCSTSRHRNSSVTAALRQESQDAERCNPGNGVIAPETPILMYQDWEHDLLGIAAQFEGQSYAPGAPQQGAIYHATSCPYYQTKLASKHGQDAAVSAADRLNSYFKAGPTERYALYYRTDTDCLSATKICNCLGKGSKTESWSKG